MQKYKRDAKGLRWAYRETPSDKRDTVNTERHPSRDKRETQGWQDRHPGTRGTSRDK